MFEKTEINFETPLPYKYTPYAVHSSKYNDTLLNTENVCLENTANSGIENNQKKLYKSLANLGFYNETLHEMASSFGFLDKMGNLFNRQTMGDFNYVKKITGLANFYLMDYYSNPDSSLKPEKNPSDKDLLTKLEIIYSIGLTSGFSDELIPKLHTTP